MSLEIEKSFPLSKNNRRERIVLYSRLFKNKIVKEDCKALSSKRIETIPFHPRTTERQRDGEGREREREEKGRKMKKVD